MFEFINDAAEEWLKELESSKWLQTRGGLVKAQLKRPGDKKYVVRYCCLGVLESIHGNSTFDGKGMFVTDPLDSDSDSREEFPFQSTIDKVCLKSERGTFIFSQLMKYWCLTNSIDNLDWIVDEEHDLSELNDDLEMNFTQIAAFIRKFAADIFDKKGMTND